MDKDQLVLFQTLMKKDLILVYSLKYYNEDDKTGVDICLMTHRQSKTYSTLDSLQTLLFKTGVECDMNIEQSEWADSPILRARFQDIGPLEMAILIRLID